MIIKMIKKYGWDKDTVKINIPFAKQARRKTENYDTEKLDMELFRELVDEVEKAIDKAIKNGEYSTDVVLKADMDINKEARKYSKTAMDTLLQALQKLGYRGSYKVSQTTKSDRKKQIKISIKW